MTEITAPVSNADEEALASFFDLPVYGVSQLAKTQLLQHELAALTARHLSHCEPYRHIVKSYPLHRLPGGADAPMLHVSLFKQLDLASVPSERIFKLLTSSGTTGQQPSRIMLDAETARLQTRALSRIVTSHLGPKRLPMLIIDHPSVVKDRRSYSARAAGILGMMTFGRHHTYALLNEDLSPNWPAIDVFAERFAGQAIVVFGFTFMVWHVLSALKASARKLSFCDALLFHSGGWKKLEDQKVDNETFRNRAKDLAGCSRVINFYGMVEQTGSVFMECENGHFHAPIFADVIMRDTRDWSECPPGKEGVIQVLSMLPRSYPGHSLLTEDRGILLGEDNCGCGRKGRFFNVLGRLKRAEIRGCSDTLHTHE